LRKPFFIECESEEAKGREKGWLCGKRVGFIASQSSHFVFQQAMMALQDDPSPKTS
jgi:hypothetical protein